MSLKPKVPSELLRTPPPESVVDEIAPHLGRFILNWGGVEFALGLWALSFSAGGKYRHRSQLSVQLIEIRKHLEVHAPESVANAEVMLAEVERLADIRYILTHGVVVHYSAEDPGWFFFVRLKPLKEEDRPAVVRDQIDGLSLSEIRAANADALTLARRLTLVMKGIWIDRRA